MELERIEAYKAATGRQRDRLFAAIYAEHKALVGKIANTRPGGFDDLCQVGSLALHDALLAFDPSHGVPFAPFAKQRIRWAIAKAGRPAARVKGCEAMYDGPEASTPCNQLDALVLAEALDRFTGRDREVAELLAAGFSGVDIAEHFGISKQRASQIIARIRKGL